MAERARGRKQRTESATEVVTVSESPDEKLIDAAVSWIKEKIEATVRKGAIDIGEYVIEKFFAGDLELVHSKNPYKNTSFRGLVERCESVELPISKSALHNAVALAAMGRLLPGKDATFLQLPPSHQTALLPLKDPAKVEKFAERAASKQLSVRDLRGLVAQEVSKAAPKDGRGRPPKPVILKALDHSLKVFTLESGRRSFTKAHFEELSEDQMKQALKTAQDLAASLTSLIEKLEAKRSED